MTLTEIRKVLADYPEDSLYARHVGYLLERLQRAEDCLSSDDAMFEIYIAKYGEDSNGFLDGQKHANEKKDTQ